jgi:hypothetical protein
MPTALLASARQHADRVGLNLFGLVDAARYDASAPKEVRTKAVSPLCGTVLVVGTGGRSCWQAYATHTNGNTKAGEAAAVALHHFVLDGVQRIEDLLRANALACCTVLCEGGGRVSFGRLGEAAGFGTVSPVSGLLLHPERCRPGRAARTGRAR